MQKNTSIINSFSAGEVSPKLAARTDLAQFQNSCRTLQNAIVIPQGGAEKRPGSYFVNEVKDSTQKTRLIPFKYSATQQYMLEFGDKYIRFYQNHAQVESSPGVPLEVVTPYTTADLIGLSYVQSADIIYFAHENYPPAKLSRFSTGWVYQAISFQTGELPVSNVGAGQTGCVRVTINNHGYASNTSIFITGVKGVPQANGIWLINVIDVDTFDLIGSSLPGWPVEQMAGFTGQIDCKATGYAPVTGNILNIGGIQGTTEANGTWKITALDQGTYPGFFTLNNSAFVNNYISGGWVSLASSYGYTGGGSATLIQPITAIVNNGSGGIRITADAHGFTTGQGVNVTGVVGTVEANSLWNVTVIDENTYDLVGSNFTHAYVSGGYGVPQTFATSNNYPSSVVFFEQRLVWGATINQPQTLWLSVTGDFENLIRGTNADDSIQYTLNSDGMNAIQWMASWNVLLLGTVDGEWRFGGSTITDPITPTSALAKVQSNKGSAKVKAILVGEYVIFVQFYGRKIYQIGYTFVSDNFKSEELTKLAPHITATGFIDMSSQESPETIIWFVRNDGVLVSMTFYTDEKIIAFCRHITQGSYEAVARLTGSSEDELWFIVNRTVNGQTKRYIEYFMPRDFIEDQSLLRRNPYFFVDCGLSFDGGDPVTITSISQTNPVVISYIGNDPANGWNVKLKALVGMQEINELSFVVANVNVTAKTFELSGVDGTGLSGYESGGTWERVVNIIALNHIAGLEVDICADGTALLPQVVTPGGFTLPDYFNRISAGLHYDYIVEPQSLEMNIQTGTSVGIIKRIEKVTLRLYNTVGCQVGPDRNNLQDVIFPIDGALFSGDLPVEFWGDYDEQALVSIVHSLPLPCTVLGVMPILGAYER